MAGGIAALREHVKALSVRIGRVQLPARVVDFAGAIHGKKNFDSMREAVKNCLLKAIADANADADAIEANLEVVKELPPEHQAIFPDLSMLALKPADDFLLAVNARIAAHEKAIADRAAELAERDRERIRAEEQEKAQAEASAKAQAEQAKATIEPAQASGGTFGGLVMDSMAFPVKAADKTPVVETIPVDPVSGAGAMMAQAEDSAPTLKLGTIAERLGFSLTADQIKAIVGIDPAAKGRTGTLYHEHQFGAICYGIQRRVRDVFAQFDSK